MCREKDCEIKKLKVELRLTKLQGRTTKQKMRSNFQWDGEDANLAKKVSDWVKTYLFPCYKFLQQGWMYFSMKMDSLSAFIERKMQSSITSLSNYRDLWDDRVIDISDNSE